MTPPREPMVVGMWSGSAGLAAHTGEVTIGGHVNWYGMPPFAFGRLADLRSGDAIYTTDASGSQQGWTVASIRARPKSEPVDPTAFAEPTGPRRLSLITCGGAFDAMASSYVDNVDVTAVPAHLARATRAGD